MGHNRCTMQRIGIVDLGSNTSRLAVYGYQPGQWFRLLDDSREMVRLGEGLGTDGRLSALAIDRATATLELFAEHAGSIGLDRLQVIATSALRDASNRDRLLTRVAHLNLSIHILSGEQEARYGVGAVANSFALEHGWVFDLGGGSAQLSRMQDRQFKEGRAYPLGAVRLTEAHLPSDPPTASQVAALEATVAQCLSEGAATLATDTAPLIAMGGSVRNLARIVQRRHGYPLALLHGYALRRDDLEQLTDQLLAATTAQRAQMAGLKPDRADVIAAAALVYRWLLRHGKREELWVSGHGMRDGAFYRHFLEAPFLLDDVRRFALDNLFAQYPQPPVHTRQVRHLCRRLFDALRPLHGYGDEAAELLDGAALLHDIGNSISYYRHHRHGAYLLTAAPLFGFSHREQALLARLVRFHNKAVPRLGAYKSLTDPEDQRLLLQLSACLRLAEALERSRAGRVRDLRVTLEEEEIVLQLDIEGSAAVEIWEASKQAPLIAQAFDRRLRILS